ncbi:hypothetical protein MCC10086_1389 [Bifidobacterium longum subsp. longum]|nr:hypothetical protein MCC10086_1389 [Bifidobacterium longum subsp. longum]
MLIPSFCLRMFHLHTSLSRRVNANSQLWYDGYENMVKLIKKGEC